MFIRSVVVALIASAVTLVNAQNVGDGMFFIFFIGIILTLLVGTYYEPGLGACGIFNTASDPIVAVGWQTFDHYPCVKCIGK